MIQSPMISGRDLLRASARRSEKDQHSWRDRRSSGSASTSLGPGLELECVPLLHQGATRSPPRNTDLPANVRLLAKACLVRLGQLHHAACVYRKLKLGRSDGEARRGSGVNE